MSNPEEEQQEYEVVEPLKHDGTRYAPGEVIYLTDKQAELLCSLPVFPIKAPPEKAKSSSGNDADQGDDTKGNLRMAPTDATARIKAIKQVITSLDAANTELFTADGKTPKVESVEAVLQWQGGITATERNEALK